MTESSFERYRFEELQVWKLGMRIVQGVCQIAHTFPPEERYALSDQLKRAATSIVLNIAEGSGQPTSKGFSLYLRRSKSSVLECVACLKIAVQEGFVSESGVRQLNEELREEYFKLIALEKSLKRS